MFLIKSVLIAIPVYWIPLTWVAKGIITQIRKVCSRFLWVGSKEDAILPWLAWDKIARPKARGCWGIKDLPSLAISLATKSRWQLLSMDNLWMTAVKRKYIEPIPINEWMRRTDKKSLNASTIWKATMESFSIVEDGLAWHVGKGEKFKIGIDPGVGCNEDFSLCREIMDCLNSQGFLSLDQIAKDELSTNWPQGWKTIEDLHIKP